MYIDRLVLLILVGLYLLSPAFLAWWSQGASAWYRPYLLWLLLIFIGYWANSGQDHDDL